MAIHLTPKEESALHSFFKEHEPPKELQGLKRAIEKKGQKSG